LKLPLYTIPLLRPPKNFMTTCLEPGVNKPTCCAYAKPTWDLVLTQPQLQ